MPRFPPEHFAAPSRRLPLVRRPIRSPIQPDKTNPRLQTSEYHRGVSKEAERALPAVALPPRPVAVAAAFHASKDLCALAPAPVAQPAALSVANPTTTTIQLAEIPTHHSASRPLRVPLPAAIASAAAATVAVAQVAVARAVAAAAEWPALQRPALETRSVRKRPDWRVAEERSPAGNPRGPSDRALPPAAAVSTSEPPNPNRRLHNRQQTPRRPPQRPTSNLFERCADVSRPFPSPRKDLFSGTQPALSSKTAVFGPDSKYAEFSDYAVCAGCIPASLRPKGFPIFGSC